MFTKGKGSSVNLLHHMQELQHHSPEVRMWENLLDPSVPECEGQTWML